MAHPRSGASAPASAISSIRFLGAGLALGASLAAVPALGQTTRPDADKPVRETPVSRTCTDCRGGETGQPPSSRAVITTPDAKTTVRPSLMREQADFRLNEALKNVPGITGR